MEQNSFNRALLPPDNAVSEHPSESLVASNEESVSTSHRPLMVNLEGVDWLLTTLVITLDAILVEIYKSESNRYATFITWFFNYHCESGWLCELLDNLFIMLVAVANVSLVIPVVSINVRTPSIRTWRCWLFAAWFSLLLVDAMTLRQLFDSIQSCRNGANVDSWVAHFFLISAAVICAILLNIRFLYLYGIFACFTCNGKRVLRTKKGLVQIYYNQSRTRQRDVRERKESQTDRDPLLHMIRPPVLHRFNTMNFLDRVSSGFNTFIDQKGMSTRRRHITPSQELTGDVGIDVHLGHLPNRPFWMRGLEYVSDKAQHAWDEVAEIENVFEYSIWIKSAAIFTILMLIYSCIKAIKMFYHLASSWDDYYKLTEAFQTTLLSTHQTLLEMNDNLAALSGNMTIEEASIKTIVDAANPDIIAVQTVLGSIQNVTGSAYDIAGLLLSFGILTTTNLTDMTQLDQNPIVSAFFYANSIVPILKYTCIIGYFAGVLIGLYSLYCVLVQHKRMSLALEHALGTRTHVIFGKENLDEEDAKVTLLGIDKKYKIGGSVYFFGILMSTAVVQMHIFGLSITCALAIIIDLKNFHILLNIGGYIIFVYVAVILTNVGLTKIVGNRLIEDGYHVNRPWLFFIYLFVFSTIHVVLGLFYALWRVLLLLATTFWVLNRLDVSFMLTGKGFDNGHYSFMSMLLLTRVIRLTNIAQGFIVAPTIQGRMQTSESEGSRLLFSQYENGISRQTSSVHSLTPPASEASIQNGLFSPRNVPSLQIPDNSEQRSILSGGRHSLARYSSADF